MKKRRGFSFANTNINGGERICFGLNTATPPLSLASRQRVFVDAIAAISLIGLPLYNYHIEFLTATILNWQHLLKEDAYKQVIVDSLQWLTEQDRCAVHGFVIMPNHVHLLWRISNLHDRFNVQGALLSYTAHRFKELAKEDGRLFKHFVADKDRTFQFWERDSLVKECWNEAFLLQKLNYIHNNPCQPHWMLAATPEEYKWSSAGFYYKGISEFGWLKHYAG